MQSTNTIVFFSIHMESIQFKGIQLYARKLNGMLFNKLHTIASSHSMDHSSKWDAIPVSIHLHSSFFKSIHICGFHPIYMSESHQGNPIQSTCIPWNSIQYNSIPFHIIETSAMHHVNSIPYEQNSVK